MLILSGKREVGSGKVEQEKNFTSGRLFTRYKSPWSESFDRITELDEQRGDVPCKD